MEHLWRMVRRPPAFYLKGAERSVFVQEFEQDVEGGVARGYYLTQDEVNQIYQFYGGQGEYDRAEILNYFYVYLLAKK